MPENADKTIQLHYIDKIHAALTETGNLISRVIVLQTLIALVIVALAASVISSSTEYELGGLNFQISFPLVLASGAVATGCLLMAQLGLVQHEDSLRNTILRLYRELGYQDQSMSNALASPLESPNVATVMLSLYEPRNSPALFYKALHTSGRVIFFGLFLFFPVGAQSFAIYQMLVMYGAQWWIFVSTFVLLISVGYAVLYFKRT